MIRILRSLVFGVLAVITASTATASTVTVDVNKVVRKVDRHKLMGSNLAIWYNPSSFQNPEMLRLFKDFQPGILRIPGGGSSDGYFWNGNGVRSSNTIDKSKYNPKTCSWKIDYSSWKPGFFGFVGFPKDPMKAEIQSWHGNCNVKDMQDFIKQLGCDTLTIVNAGTGTPEVAAEWVRWANKKMGYNVKYWEVGNELGGSWENGHVRPDGRQMDGKIYAGILKNFSIAMKKVDPTVKVGAQADVTWVKDLMEIAGDQIDFINDHIYFFSGAAEPQDMFSRISLLRTNVQVLKAAIRKYNPKRADQIEVGISEYNAKLYEDINTANLFSGVWMTAALAEMMYAGQDMAMQWDTFTQKQADGGGHGFILENSMTPKAEYWAFWMMNHFFGDNILEASTDDGRLITYASKDEAGNLYVLVVNRSESEPVSTVLDLKSAGGLAPTAQMPRLSQLEYRWGSMDFKPLWNPGPTVLTVPAGKGASYTFPPMSASIVKFSPAQTASGDSLVVLGRPDKVFPTGVKASVEILAISAGKTPLAGVELTTSLAMSGKPGVNTKVVTDKDGKAVVPVTTPAQPGVAVMTVKAKTASAEISAECPLTFAQPLLLLNAPEQVAFGETFDVEVIAYYENNGMKLFESFDYDCALAGAPQKMNSRFVNGSAIFHFADGNAGTLTLSASVPSLALNGRESASVKIFTEKEKEVIACKFDEKSDMQYVETVKSAAPAKGAKDKAKVKKPVKDAKPAAADVNKIDMNIRPNQGVLSVALNDFKGWSQDSLNFIKMNEIKTVNWPKVVAVTFDIYIPDDFDASDSYASLIFSLQSEANYWMPLDAYDLLKIPKGQWTKVRMDIKPEFQKAMQKFFKIMVIFNCGGPLKGHLYIDNLGYVQKVMDK